MNEVRIADKIAAMIDDLNVWLPQDVQRRAALSV
jgi:hypothetical protein